MDVLDLAESGPYMEEGEFDLRVAKLCRELAEEYDIRYDPERVVVDDDSLADAVFDAGLRLASEVGMYCLNARRVIRFSEEQLLEGLLCASSPLTIGRGRDARVLYARGVEDGRRPIIFGGQPGASIPEEWFLPTAVSYMMEPLVDAVNHGRLDLVGGRRVRARSPLEAIATRRELTLLREAARRAGRPGIHLIAGESSVTCVGALAVASERYLRTSDAHLIGVICELKTDYDRLTKAVCFADYGALSVTLADPLIGWFAGGPDGAAICAVASLLLGRLAYRSAYYVCHPNHLRVAGTSNPECLWVASAVGHAMARRAHTPVLGAIWTASGAGTEEVFYEVAAATVASVVSGFHPAGVSSASGIQPNASGLEVRFMAEVAIAVAESGLSRSESNEIVRVLLKRYALSLEEPKIGRPFPELYDLRAVTPREWWLQLYQKMRKGLEEITGLPLGSIDPRGTEQ